MKKIITLLFIFGLAIRIYSFFPSNIILGYDQVRDLFTAKSIWYEKDIKIIGPTAGNNLNLHHGVAFLYYVLLPIVLFKSDPFWISVWNSIFNSLSVVVLYFFAKSLFKSKPTGLVSAFIAAISYYFVSYSGWISNPSPTLLIVPLFFFFFWKFLIHNSKFLILAAIFLGLSIQFELFFIYLLPVSVVIWIIFRPKFPGLKILALSLGSFLIATSTMILTEIKFKFVGTRDIFLSVFGGSTQGEGIVKNFDYFITGYWKTFSDNLWPGNVLAGKNIAILIFVVILYGIIKNKKLIRPLIFLLIYLLSPILMLVAGFHGSRWFLIGLAPAVVISAGYVISRLKRMMFIAPIVFFVFLFNFRIVSSEAKSSPKLLGPDESSFLSYQLAVVDYTYNFSGREPFAINSVTNPLYINAVWAYHYDWYGKRTYGYLPAFMGGDQLHPYDTLPKATGKEKYLYLIIDTTFRIPEVHRILARDWADKISHLEEEKLFGSILVQKRRISARN